MGVFSWLASAFRSALAFIKNIWNKVINGIVNFARDVVAFFKNLRLNPNRDVPFVANKEDFKEALRNAPRKSLGVLQGVYNQATDDFEHVQDISADGLDQQTKNLLGRDKLVVVS